VTNREKLLMNAARLHINVLGAALALGLALLQTACVILPARFASGVSGSVVDAESGRPVADAIVVVRFDGRNGDVLPDRQVLGHREAVTDADGRFHARFMVRPGISIWPVYKTDARVVAVLRDGYRCARPLAIREDAPVRIALQPAAGVGERRASCRPVPANRGEAEAYMAAWRELFPPDQLAFDAESQRQLARVLEARSVLGFGQNCEGPVSDLALAPDGRRVAFAEGRERPAVRLVTLSGDAATTELVAEEASSAERRLAWTSTGDLALWTPADETRRSYSASVLGPDRIDVVWKARQRRSAPPAAPDHAAAGSSRPPAALLEPADLSDEGDSRWFGRSFRLERGLDPESGLAADRLVIVGEDGHRRDISLPGEACGPTGRFGRPHYRITAGGNSGIDLRFVDGGCHAIQIDFGSGAWRKLDASDERASCQSVGNIPATHLETALRGYARDVQAARIAAGGDHAAAFALMIGPDGATRVETRNLEGEIVSAAVPDFPLRTPLKRIQVSIVGAAGFTGPAAPATRGLEPL
jgi:hypothetical protein